MTKEGVILKRTENIQFKASPEEKQIMLDNSARANTDLSKYLRTIATEEGKVIFLDKGGYIPRGLIEINDKINGALRNGKISDALGHELLSGIKEIMTKFVEISQQLTIINNCDEEGA